MQYEVIKKSSNLVHGWTGGSTAEIFLYPRDSDYKKKNFEIRVSAAFTTGDNAEFSDFSGFKRFISPTEGVMLIKHKDRYKKELKPFEIDVCDGAWNTFSDGTYHEFNLLLSKDWDGFIKPLGDGEKIGKLPEEEGFAGIFFCEQATVNMGNGQTAELDEGDLLLFTLPIDLSNVEIRSSKTKRIEKVGFYWRACRKTG